MTQNNPFPVTFGDRQINLHRDIAALEGMVQHAVESFQDFATLFARIKAVAQYAASSDLSGEDRQWAMSVVAVLSEQAELDLQQHHDTLRLTASRYWMTRYGASRPDRSGIDMAQRFSGNGR